MYESIAQLLSASPSLPGATSALPPGRAYSPETQGSMNVPNALPTPVEFLDNYLIAGSPSFDIGVTDLGPGFASETPEAQKRANDAIRNNAALQGRIRDMREQYAGILRGV
jgi:hypothetical protein